MSPILNPQQACNAAVCNAFKKTAERTWTYLKTCQLPPPPAISVSEDTITTNILVSLKYYLPSALVVIERRPVEKFIGCDFEMWIGSAATGWRGYAVQAKRLKIASASYPYLHHVNQFGAQINLLNSYATAAQAEPIYLFYNSCMQHVSNLCSSAYATEQIGCTVTPSHVVANAIASGAMGRKYSWIHSQPETSLWRCLACCPCTSGGNCFNGKKAKTMQRLPDHIGAAMDGRADALPKGLERGNIGPHARWRKGLVVIDTSMEYPQSTMPD